MASFTGMLPVMLTEFSADRTSHEWKQIPNIIPAGYLTTHSEGLMGRFTKERKSCRYEKERRTDGKMFVNKDVTLVWVWERSFPGSCSNIHSSFSPRECRPTTESIKYTNILTIHTPNIAHNALQ